MLQRQIMFKQLEELQRQKKLQQLNDSRQENVINQQSSFIHNKQQPSGAQFPPLINGTPVRDPSQMFMFGNTNLVQGIPNGSLYSQPGHGFTRFSNFQHEQQMDTVVTRSSLSDQNQHQFNNVGYQEQGEIQTDINPQDFTSLDPLEQKFLFNSDDNNFGSMFEDTDTDHTVQVQSFPSLQSGSWSALMQSALDETSSTDTGIQEEWSGLSFQNPEPSVDNNNNNNNNNSNNNHQPSNIIESRKPPTSWQMQNNVFQQFRSDSSHGSNKEGGESSGMSAVLDNKSVQDSNAQTSRHMLELLHKVDKFREYKHGSSTTTTTTTTNSCLTESTQSQSKILKSETTDAFTPSVPQQAFGLKLSPPTQMPAGNYFDSSHISQHVATSHLKNQDGQQGSAKSQPNVWVDILPSHSRIDTASESQSEGINSQTFDYGQGQNGKFQSGEESFSGRAESQSHISPHGYSPLKPTYSGAGVKRESVSDHPKVPQVMSMSALASAYENYKTVLASSKDNSLVKSPFYPPFQDPSQLHRNSSFVQMNLANNSISKKRKFPTFELLPWHKEATEGSKRLHDISIVEQEWGHAVNRVPEKVIEGGSNKKRIILTTELMQVLFRPPPKILLNDDAFECCQMVTYFAARLALGDACSLANQMSRKESGDDENLLKIVEDFVDRSNKIQDAVLRLENGGSVLEIRMESQDLERFSVINRFAKFHSRAQMAAAAADTATTTTASGGGGSGAPKLYPQRYVTASQMPRVVPEGHNCLSL